MTISYPFNDALLLTPKPSRMTLRYLTLSTISQSPFTGQIQAIKNPAAGLFGISLAFPPMSLTNAAKWVPLFNSLYGSFGSILLPMYGRESIAGSGAGTPVVDGDDQTGTTLSIKGMTPLASGVFTAFDLINIGSNLYEVVRDVDADSSGEGSIELWPSLRASPSDEDTILTSSVTGVFRQKPDFEFDVDLNSAFHYGFGWDGVEAV